MKRVENRKVAYPSGHLSYFMNRTMPDGSPYRYAMHLSPADVAQGRRYIAMRLRIARSNMRESIQNLTGADVKGRRNWVEGRTDAA